MKIKSIITLLLVAMVAIFVIQNATIVDIKFIFWSLTVPRALLVVILLVVGFMSVITISSFSKLKNDLCCVLMGAPGESRAAI